MSGSKPLYVFKTVCNTNQATAAILDSLLVVQIDCNEHQCAKYSAARRLPHPLPTKSGVRGRNLKNFFSPIFLDLLLNPLIGLEAQFFSCHHDQIFSYVTLINPKMFMAPLFMLPQTKSHKAKVTFLCNPFLCNPRVT